MSTRQGTIDRTPAYQSKLSPEIRDVLVDGWDRGDKWGSAINFLFAISEAIYHEDDDSPDPALEEIPAEWQYRHGLFDCGEIPDEYDHDGDVDWGTFQLRMMVKQGEITSTDLVAFGRVLDRLLEIYRIQGLDY